MKKILLAITGLFMACLIFAQTPQAFKYQAVVRDNTGNLMVEQTVNFQIDILKGSTDGSAVYSETHSAMTSEFGLVNLEVGNGTSTDDFSAIEWNSDSYFIKIWVNGDEMGTSQLLSVPYALHANTADSLTGTIIETQSLGDVAGINNSVNTQIKNVSDPTDPQDAATKAYVTMRVSTTGDSLFMGEDQWVIVTGISAANHMPAEEPTITDVDGNVYATIAIGEQVWMAENLKVTNYPDGTPIADGTNDSYISYTEKYYFIYQNDPTYKDTYGLLYSWSGATNGVSSSANPSGVQGVCPDGWHLPSNAEKTQLITFLGGPGVAGGKLKEEGFAHWVAPNEGANNETGFGALGTGTFFYQLAHRYEYGLINQVNGIWTCTTNENHVDETTAYAINLSAVNTESPIDNSDNKGNGQSVRCIKDE